MQKHESKTCPRCEQEFICRAGDIANCDCSSITMTIEERAFVEDRYQGCLCINCIRDLKNKYVLFKEKFLEGK